jgi:hypothetical protein
MGFPSNCSWLGPSGHWGSFMNFGSCWFYLLEVPGSTWQYLAVPGSTWYPSLQDRQRLLASSSSRLPSKAWRSHGLFGAKALHALTVFVGSCALLKSIFQIIPDISRLYIPMYSTIQQSTIDNSHKSALLCFLTWEGMDGVVVLPLQI